MQDLVHLEPDALATLGYTDISLINESEGFRTYRACARDGQSVFVKIPASAEPQAALIRQLEHELEIAAGLNPDYVVQPISIEQIADQRALILKASACQALSNLLQAPMDMDTFLPIAIGVVESLTEVHKHGLVHKAIRPENIHVLSIGKVKLTGFGAASRLLHERQPLNPPQLLDDDLTYIAPEQTGRMNRSIDSRSDLYALGVVFYQMLTGQLPFKASEPMEWVHCHIARQPIPPQERLESIPKPLSDIIMKLLAKTAEERYQSVEGLKHDLERCLEEWQAHQQLHSFPLGEHDTPDQLMISEKLYGREREVAMLLAAFDLMVSSGKPELMLVSGYAGIGKSRVVNELHKAIVPSRGLFSAGKYAPSKRGIPYSALAQAFKMLIRPLLGKSDAELGVWRRDLQEALDPNGRLMVEFVPELKLIIGEQPTLPKLDPQQVKARFQLVCRRFIGVFARAEHPLVLFMDDLQWLDAATLDLIEDLATQEDIHHLLLIGAYRDNEVDSDHPLRHKLESIRNAGARTAEIQLSPLTLADLTKLIMDSLHCEPERASQLADLVHTKTAGNPFFAIQFLTTLAEEGLISYDHGRDRWSWEMNRIHAKGYTDNVADLMATKLTRLPSTTQNAMQLLACLGTSSPMQTLSQVLEVTEDEVDVVFQEAVRLEFVQKTENAYQFVHDRIQEAAYTLIPEASRAETHLRIGRALLAHAPEDEHEVEVFEIVTQLNRGMALIDTQAERDELARMNLLAGKRAKGSTAYTEALTYLTTGASLLSEDCWKLQHQLAFALTINQAECEYLTGELEAAENRLTTLFSHATGSIELASIASLSIDVYMTLGKIDRAVVVGLDYLRHRGIDWPAHPSEEQARREYDLIWTTLGDRAIEDLIDLPITSDPALLATMEILIKLRPPALFTDANLVSMVICKAVNLSLEHGNSDGSCFAYASLGIVAGSHYGNYVEAYRFGKLGYELVEQRGLRRFRARTYTNFAMFDLPWVKHVRAGRDLLRRAFNDSNRSGDIIYGAYACNNLIANLLLAGDPLIEVEHEASNSLGYVNKARFGLVADIITSQLGLIRSLRGHTLRLGSFSDEQFDERQFELHFTDRPELAVAECFHWIRKLQALCIAGDYAAAIEASDKAQPLLLSAKPFIEIAEYSFYAALARTVCCSSTSSNNYQQHKETITTHLRQLEIWAKECPENFDNRAFLVGAEIARIEDRPLDAMHLYEKAIQSAHANSFVHNEALANELAGRFYIARGLESTGLAYLRQARSCYIAWGADGKRQQLDSLYPLLSVDRGANKTSGTDSLSPQLDVATVILASHALSGEIELPKLIETLITHAIKYAGADRGLLILPKDNGFEVEVEATTLGTGIEVRLIRSPAAKTVYPEPLVNYVINTEKSVILDDALQPGKFSEDLYFRHGKARSILCIPMVRQGKLSGVLYLENTLAAGVFTPDRVAVLDVLAAQAAISLENARLYEELRKSEAKYQRMFETANEGIWVQDEDFRTTFVNEHMAKMLGYSAAELMNHKVIEFMFEEDAANHTCKMKERSENISDVYERRMRHKNGSEVWMLISATPIFEHGRFSGSFAMLTNITERKKAEQQLSANEHLFRTLVENSPDFIARYDRHLNRVYINPTLQRIFKVPVDRALRKPPRFASPLVDPERYMAHIRWVIDNAQERSDETAHLTPQGELRWASTRFAPEIGLDGKVESVLVISNDITEQKHAELERQAHMLFLQSLDRINRVFQGEGDIEQIMNRALKEVLDIFDCDRAYLIYPNDPTASTWSVPIESTKPEYPGANPLGPLPMNEGIAWVIRTLLESDRTVCMGPGTPHPIPKSLQEQFAIRSLMSTLLRPRVDTPWQFGIQQCSHDRIWTDQEVRLFDEISNRLTDSLNNLLITRNLRNSEERFRLVYENSPIPIWEEDFSGVKSRLNKLNETYGSGLEAYLIDHPEIVREYAAQVGIININNAALELHEADSKAQLYEGLPKTFITESYDAFRQELIAIARGETELLFDAVVQTLKGNRREVSVSFSVCPGYEQSLSKVFVSLYDLTKRKQDEDQLRLAASVFSTSQEGILISDANNRIIDINPAFSRLTGFSREEALGQDPGFLSAGRQPPEFYVQMWQSIDTTGEWQGELWNRRKSGEVYPELLSIVAVKDAQGQLQHYVGVFSDISMIKQHEADLDRIAHYDMLTSVPNRRLLGDRLEQAIAHAGRHSKKLAICYLDLDGFKPINDQFGHEAGDLMLIEIAHRLEEMSRAEDTVARLGGDEFALLWNDIGSEADCHRALERILDKVSEPMSLGKELVSVSASVGVTLYPEDYVDADSLLRHADHAMYTAKQLGKNRYQIFDARLERQISAQAQLLSMVSRGLDQEQFELYYQPKVDYTTGQLVGAEALLRWNDPVLGLVGPKEFLSLIENDILAFRMGRWVMEEAVRQAKRWHDLGITLPISINIFPRHLKSRNFLDDLRKAIESHWPHMPKQRLLMEIVETEGLEELAPIESVITECLDMGIGFSLDDFGTGYSSLVYLRRLSIEELKIDQTFVRDMLDDPNDEAIVVGVIRLGQAFGLRVVAEGVETVQQAEHLVNLGCPIVQGYGFGRPAPAHAFQKWHAKYIADEMKICRR